MKIKDSSFLIEWDKNIDKIPVLSTFSNFTNIISKIAINNKREDNVNDNKYLLYLKKKKFSTCVLLLVPVIGNVLVVIDNWMTDYIKDAPRKRVMYAPAVCKALHFCVQEEKKQAELEREWIAHCKKYGRDPETYEKYNKNG